MSNIIFSDSHPIPKINPPDTELFGEFQNFTKNAQTQQSNQSQDFLQLNKRLDDIVYQIELLRAEVKETKELLNINQQHAGTPRPVTYNGVVYTEYPSIPSYYPGQWTLFHRNQQQNRYNSHLNSFQTNS